MFTLFIDTTFGITVGLLDESHCWKAYNYIDSSKSSSIIHKIINDLLSDLGVDESSLKRLVQVSGPGSYTGMRVSDGISQIFEWQNIETYAIHHFQVPKILGINEGMWLAKAFKGEIFCHQWSKDQEKNFLILESQLNEITDMQSELFVGHTSDFTFDTTQTSILIKENSEKIFKYIFENQLKEPLYYFRSIEDEFSKGK